MPEAAKVTETEKMVYNKYLAVSRSSINKPFKLRKDWTKFEENSNYPYVSKLAFFFNKHSHVDMDDFFKAPYDIYSDKDNPFDLKFYISQRALKVYTLYMQKKRVQSPDTDDQLFAIKKSLQYILTYCTRNNIQIDRYIHHSTGSLPAFLTHLKKGDVTIYTLFGFSDFEKVVKSIDAETLEFVLSDIYHNLPRSRTQYQASRLAKTFITAGLDKIKTACKSLVAFSE